MNFVNPKSGYVVVLSEAVEVCGYWVSVVGQFSDAADAFEWGLKYAAECKKWGLDLSYTVESAIMIDGDKS